MQVKIIIVIIGVLGLWGAGCGRGKERKESALAQVENSGAVPAAVKNLVRAVADNDSVGFAALVSYPLQRPYPLRDIDDASEMENYYSTLIDDSIKRVMTESGPDKWSEYGWRGWSVCDGEYVWVDSTLYDIPYVSGRERKELDEVRRQDISTLAPELREGWEPVAAMRSEDGRLWRIDARNNSDTSADGNLRLMMYDADADVHDLPQSTMSGRLVTEGSALEHNYTFAMPDGGEAIWNPNPPDGASPAITVTSPDGFEDVIPVRKIYWLDLVKKK